MASSEISTPILYSIYVLIDPRDFTVRYVGLTKNTIKQRFGKHLYDARHNCRFPVQRWIARLLEMELKPIPALLEETYDPTAETHWILCFRQQAARLLNCNDGGSAINPTPETREKLRQVRLGKKMPEEQKAKIAAAHKGRKRSPEVVLKSAEARHGQKRTPEFSERLSAILKGKKMPPRTNEHKEKLRQAQAGKPRWSPTDRALMSLTRRGRPMPPRTQEHRRKLSEANQGQAPNYGAKKVTPEIVREIRALNPRSRQAQEEVGRRYGLSGSGVKKMVLGETWKHIT
jgi:hypothetical protein